MGNLRKNRIDQTSKIDLEKALRLKSFVKSGNFDLIIPSSNETNERKKIDLNFNHKKFNDFKDSTTSISTLLLDPRKLKAATDEKYSKALMVQHKSVWKNHLTRIAQKAEELNFQVDNLPMTLFNVRKQVESLQIFITENGMADGGDDDDEMHEFQKLYIELMAKDFKDLVIYTGLEREVDSVLKKLLNKKYDADLHILNEVNQRVLTRRSSKDSSGSISGSTLSLNSSSTSSQLQDEIEKNLAILRHEEMELEKSLPWMTDPCPEPETESQGWDQKLTICSLFSPTRIKEPKRLSRDEAQQPEQEISKPTKNSLFRKESGSGESRKKSLDQVCNVCGERLSVKFNFDRIDESDADRWLQFDCVRCSIDRDDRSVQRSEASSVNEIIEEPTVNEFGLDVRDRVQEYFSNILKDISMFYTKKLDMLHIKMQHHERTRADKQHFELAQSLLEVYSEHDNKEELWKDMFCRMVEGSNQIYANSILRWMRDEQCIRSAISACLSDLRRERDKVIVSMKQVLRRREEEKQRLWNHKEKQKLQETYCNELKHLLEGLRHQREIRSAEERRIAEEEEKKLKEKEQKEKEKQIQRQRRNWSLVRKHKREQEELRFQKRSDLLQELRSAAMRRREWALQNYIRANLRRVMADQKTFELGRIKAEKEMDEKEREARLETLRRLGRRRLGLDLVKHEDEDSSTALQATKAWSERAKVVEAERIHRTTGKGLELPVRAQLFPIHTYSDSTILADNRILVENILREKNLLMNNAYAVAQMLKEISPPTRPRPDVVSQLVLH